MNSQIVIYYGVYNTDDRGYRQEPPISIWPIRAAAQTQLKNGYMDIAPVNILKVEDLNYIIKKEIPKNRFVGKLVKFLPTVGYYEHVYQHGQDFSLYYSEFEELHKKLADGQFHTISKILIYSDGEKYFELASADPVNIEKIVPSRELAVAHALSKLTQEEKDLLGIWKLIIINGKVKGKKDSLLILIERDAKNKIINHISVIIDGIKLKENVFYSIVNGELVETN